VRRRDIHVSTATPASPDVVYGLLAHGSTWPAWSPIESVELEQAGNPPPEGVGAIRVNRRGRTTGRDQILELVRDRKFKYATLSGLPFNDYIGEVDLKPAIGGGTTIHWHSSFMPKIFGTGWILQRGLHSFLGQCVSGLAEYAATSSDISTPQ
jgi:Polyketide cyclase / dehydrase and lipid transport